MLKRRRGAVRGVDAPAFGASPEAALLQRAGRGDEAAFADLYDALASFVYGIVLKVVRDPAQSEEVAQEVFVELWRLAPRYEAGRSSVRSWAATLAHRRAVDRVRSEQAARDRVERDATSAVRDHDVVSEVVTEQIDGDLDRARVRRSLEHLSDAQREAVELAYFGGYTYREVAALLDVPEGTIKTRIRDGLIRLRGELGVAS